MSSTADQPPRLLRWAAKTIMSLVEETQPATQFCTSPGMQDRSLSSCVRSHFRRECRTTSVERYAVTSNIDVRLSTEVIAGSGEGRLQHLVLVDRATDKQETVAADALFVLIGADPHTDWLPLQMSPEIRMGFY